MNKYKIVSIVLAVSLLGALARLVYETKNNEPVEVESTATVVYQNILSRKSVRSFTDEKISRAQLDTLLHAAMAAPTGRDMRPWKFIVVDDRAAMDSLSEKLPYAKMLTSAQAAILVCGDLRVQDKEGHASVNWQFDCSAATENLLLMAEAMGLGAVWTGVHPYPERIQAVKSAFNLPDHIIPLNLIPIGYPKGNPRPKQKYDEHNVHYNGW